MSKYHRAFKLKVAMRAECESPISLSKEYGVSISLVKYWSSVYRIHGITGFRSSGSSHSFDFKIKVLTAMRVNDWSLAYTSAYFDLSTPGILFQWQKLYSLEGISRLHPKRRGRPRMKHNPSEPKLSEQMTEKELRDELDYLRAENAVLKKLDALAQAKKKQAKKRP